MPEMNLPVSPEVYNAVLELQRRLQKEYGPGVTLSDTVDFLGYQSFLFNGLLGVAETWLKVTKSEAEKNPTLVDRLLEAVGAHRPEVATCFVRANVDIPLRWADTRWLTDMEGKNIVKCLFEEKPEGKPEIEQEIKSPKEKKEGQGTTKIRIE